MYPVPLGFEFKLGTLFTADFLGIAVLCHLTPVLMVVIG